ncbi:MAG TPA: hypothetical protein VFY04_11855 [Solirubrobacterales bacterium]|nr:hypothetical protein [Solirubrobacterales bacterium]
MGSSGGWDQRRRRAVLGAWSLAIVILSTAVPTAFGANGTGSLDRSFGDFGRATATAPLGSGWLDADVQLAEGSEGDIVVGSGDTVVRFDPDGRLDGSFGADGRLALADSAQTDFTLRDLAIDPAGRVLVFGAAVSMTETEEVGPYPLGRVPESLGAVRRYDQHGNPDPTFGGGDGLVTTDFGLSPTLGKIGTVRIARGIVDDQSRPVVLGSVRGIGGCGARPAFIERRLLISRLTSDGQPDPAFGLDGQMSHPPLYGIGEWAFGPGHEPVIAGWLEGGCVPDAEGGPSPATGMIDLRSDGSLDESFGEGGRRYFPTLGSIADLVVDRRGRIVVRSSMLVTRLTADGELDRSFGRGGRTAVQLPKFSGLTSMAVDTSGGVLLVGTLALRKREAGAFNDLFRRSFTVIRLHSSGRPDRGFGKGGWIATRFGRRSSVVPGETLVDAEDRLVVAGAIARPDMAPTGGFAVARYRVP